MRRGEHADIADVPVQFVQMGPWVAGPLPDGLGLTPVGWAFVAVAAVVGEGQWYSGGQSDTITALRQSLRRSEAWRS